MEKQTGTEVGDAGVVEEATNVKRSKLDEEVILVDASELHTAVGGDLGELEETGAYNLIPPFPMFEEGPPAPMAVRVEGDYEEFSGDAQSNLHDFDAEGSGLVKLQRLSTEETKGAGGHMEASKVESEKEIPAEDSLDSQTSEIKNENHEQSPANRSQKKKYQCVKCPYIGTWTAWNYHKRLHSRGKVDTTTCSVCGCLILKRSLKRHNTMHHSTTPPEGNPIRETTPAVPSYQVAPIVPVGVQGQDNDSQVDQHARDLAKPNAFVCICGETFRVIGGLENHVRRFQN